MQTYRLIIRRHDRLLGHFETSAPWAREALDDVLQRLPAIEGYRVEMQVSRGERRLLESSPAGLRLLSVEALFEPLPPDA